MFTNRTKKSREEKDTAILYIDKKYNIAREEISNDESCIPVHFLRRPLYLPY